MASKVIKQDNMAEQAEKPEPAEHVEKLETAEQDEKVEGATAEATVWSNVIHIVGWPKVKSLDDKQKISDTIRKEFKIYGSHYQSWINGEGDWFIQLQEASAVEKIVKVIDHESEVKNIVIDGNEVTVKQLKEDDVIKYLDADSIIFPWWHANYLILNTLNTNKFSVFDIM